MVGELCYTKVKKWVSEQAAISADTTSHVVHITVLPQSGLKSLFYYCLVFFISIMPIQRARILTVYGNNLLGGYCPSCFKLPLLGSLVPKATRNNLLLFLFPRRFTPEQTQCLKPRDDIITPVVKFYFSFMANFKSTAFSHRKYFIQLLSY